MHATWRSLTSALDCPLVYDVEGIRDYLQLLAFVNHRDWRRPRRITTVCPGGVELLLDNVTWRGLDVVSRKESEEIQRESARESTK